MGYACKGNEFTIVTYTSDDCTGDPYLYTVDFDELNESYDGCYEVCSLS